MATARATKSRSPNVAETSPAEQITAPTEQDQSVGPRQRASKVPRDRSPFADVRDIQRRALADDANEDHINVRLCLDASDADGVRFFDESLPVSLVRALLDPMVANFFIPIEGNGRMKPLRTRSHWLHTQYIREIILLDDLPEENT